MSIFNDFAAVDREINNTKIDMASALESLNKCRPGTDGFDEFDLELIERSIRGLEIIVSRVTGDPIKGMKQ